MVAIKDTINQKVQLGCVVLRDDKKYYAPLSSQKEAKA